MGSHSLGQAKQKAWAYRQSKKFNQNRVNPESKQEQPLDAWTSEGGSPGIPENENNKNKSEKENVHISASDEGNKKSEAESGSGRALSANNHDTDEENSWVVNSSPDSPAKRSAYGE